jgi:hypothetical protein
MQTKTDYLTLHQDDFKVIGRALNAVNYIEVDEDAVQRRSDALIRENIAASRKFEERN